MTSVGAILLAAGLSNRMGERNKLLLPVRGEPMIRRVAQHYLDAIDGELTVVTGHQSGEVETALSGLPLQLVHNASYADGQPTSVAAGLRHAPDVELLLIGLGDQPLLTSDDLTALVKAHIGADPAKITIPVKGEARGNPIVIPANLRPRLLENPKRPGCMSFTRTHPEHVQRLEMAQPGFYVDIDTPQAYDDLMDANRMVVDA